MKCANALILATSCILTACGGSSSDSSNTTTPPPSGSSPVVISSGNATSVGKVAAEVALQSSDLGGVGTVVGVTSSTSGGISKMNDAIGKTANAAVSLDPFGPQIAPCAVSGTITVSGDIADPLTYTAGDSINVDANNCDDGTGVVIDGLVEMTIASFSGDILFTGLFEMGMDLVVTDFTATEDGLSETANGDVGSTISTLNLPVSEGSVFGDSFSIASASKTESLSNFSSIYTEDTSSFPVAWTNDAMGTVDSTEITGSISYDTPVPFAGFGDSYPHTGELLVTGANNATLRLITLDDVNVQIDADYDGDGMVDETLTMTWDELATSGD